MSLTGKSPADTYKDILKVSNNNSGIDSTARAIESGDGTNSAITLSDRALKVRSYTDNTTAFTVRNLSGTTKFQVDTTNNQVKALGTHVNTQYAEFSIGNTEATAFSINTHEALCFQNANFGSLSGIPSFGTGTDPATTFTTAEGSGTRASDLVPVLWYVPDAISIDGVYGLEGADTATGDTTRMHLFSYTFTSGSTSALTSGTLLAHNHAGDEVGVANGGSEQAYLTTFTVDSASVAAGKVILAFFRSDSINSDYSLKIKIKYHLT